MRQSYRKKNSEVYFVCAPNDYWIKVTYTGHNSMEIMICKEKEHGKERLIHKKSITIDDFDRKKDLNKAVKNFCEYFVTQYASHSDLVIKYAAQSLSACYTKYGLKIWRKKRKNPYA